MFPIVGRGLGGTMAVGKALTVAKANSVVQRASAARELVYRDDAFTVPTRLSDSRKLDDIAAEDAVATYVESHSVFTQVGPFWNRRDLVDEQITRSPVRLLESPSKHLLTGPHGYSYRAAGPFKHRDFGNELFTNFANVEDAAEGAARVSGYQGARAVALVHDWRRPGGEVSLGFLGVDGRPFGLDATLRGGEAGFLERFHPSILGVVDRNELHMLSEAPNIAVGAAT